MASRSPSARPAASAKAVRKRGPGRRPSGSVELTSADIVARGLALSREVPLQDLSIVRLAGDLGVTPASVHYHLASRQALTDGIIRLFVREMNAQWPTPTGHWQEDLRAVATLIYRHYRSYPGIASYFAVQNRFALLVPAAGGEGSDDIFTFLERYFEAVRRVGLDDDQSAIYATLLIQFLHMSAHRSAQHQWPAEQTGLRHLVTSLPPARYPNIAGLRRSYLDLGGETAFDAGLALLLAGIEMARASRRKAAQGPAAREKAAGKKPVPRKAGPHKIVPRRAAQRKIT